MKTEGTIGTATLLAIAAAVVGFSLQSGPKQEGSADRNGAANRGKPALTKKDATSGPGCSNLQEQLEDFLETKHLAVPEECSGPKDASANEDLTEKTSQLKFVVAILPDPAHTHLPVVFDQFAVAIQEAAQDEKYDFDASWLPWEDDETPYPCSPTRKPPTWKGYSRRISPGSFFFERRLTVRRIKRSRSAVSRNGQRAGSRTKTH